MAKVPYYTRDLRGYRAAFLDASSWLEGKLPYWRWHVEVYRACREMREATWSPEESAPNTAEARQDDPGRPSGTASWQGPRTAATATRHS